MKEVQIIYVHADDWCGLYVNGHLKDQGHSMQFSDIMEAVESAGGRVTRWAEVEADYGWLVDVMGGHLPDTLGEVELVEPFPAGLIFE